MKRLLLPLLAALALPTAGNADLGEADTIPKVKESKETKFDAWCVKKYNECSINLENGRLIVNEGTGVSYEQIIEWSKYNIYRRKIGLINFIGPHHLYTYRFKYKDKEYSTMAPFTQPVFIPKTYANDSTGLSDADIDKMVNEAQAHAEEDKSKKESVETRNQADSMVYSTEKSLAEHGDKLDSKDKESIEKSIEELKDVLKNENADGAEIKSKLEALNTAAMKLGEIMYKENPQANQAAETEQEKGSQEKDSKEKDANDENVVDADFEEVDEESEKKSN